MKRQKRSHGEGTISKRGDSWRFQYWINGKRVGKTVSINDYPTRKLANQAKADWIAKLNVQAKANAGEVVTVGHLLKKFVDLQFREKRAGASNVKQMVDRYVIPKLGHLDARDPGLLAKVETYIDTRQLEKTYKGSLTRNATINNEISYLKSALKLLRPEPRILLLKKLDTKDGIRQGLVSPEEYLQLLTELESYQKSVWCFAYHTGVRQGQLLKLRREWAIPAVTTGVMDVPGRYGPLRITKNGEPHFIPIYTDSMWEFLKWALETGDPNCPFLFQRDGKRISKHTYYQALKRIQRKLGLAHIHFHDLRRTAVTNMIEAGIPPEDAMAVSGHLDPSMLKRYNIVTNAKRRASVTRVGAVMKPWHEKNFAADCTRIAPEKSAFTGAISNDVSKPN